MPTIEVVQKFYHCKGPFWIRPTANLFQLPISYSGPTDVSREHTRQQDICFSLLLLATGFLFTLALTVKTSDLMPSIRELPMEAEGSSPCASTAIREQRDYGVRRERAGGAESGLKRLSCMQHIFHQHDCKTKYGGR